MDGSATSDKVAKSVKNKNSKTKLRDSDTENVNKNTSFTTILNNYSFTTAKYQSMFGKFITIATIR